jgi:hypothetical protein
VKILIYDLNYAPEITGIGQYIGELGAWLASKTHQVKVVAAPRITQIGRSEKKHQINFKRNRLMVSRYISERSMFPIGPQFFVAYFT